MNRSIGGTVRIVSVIALVVVAFGVGALVGVANAQSGQPAGTDKLFAPFWQAWNIVHQQYVDIDKMSDTKLMEGAISGMVASLGDAHSDYLDPVFFANETGQLAGQFEGIGASVQKDVSTGGLKIITTFDGSPARGLLKSGDLIITVDGDDITHLA